MAHPHIGPHIGRSIRLGICCLAGLELALPLFLPQPAMAVPQDWGSMPAPPEVGEPTCVAYCDGQSGSSSNSSDTDWQARAEARAAAAEARAEAARIRAQEQRARAEARAQAQRTLARQTNDQGVAAYNAGDFTQALRLFQQARAANPTDPVINKNLAQTQAELARIEQARQQLQAEIRHNQELARLLPVPLSPPVPGNAAPLPSVSPVPPPGFDPGRWQALQEARNTVRALYAKSLQPGGLRPPEDSQFFNALKLYNQIWAEATTQPQDQTSRSLRVLNLPVAVNPNAPAPRMLSEQLTDAERKSDAAPAEPNLITDFTASKSKEMLEDAAAEAVRNAHGDQLAKHFGRMLSVGKIALAAVNEGVSGAAAEGTEWVIGKLPKIISARYEMVREAGQIYSTTTRNAMFNFVEKTNKGLQQLGGAPAMDPAELQKAYEEDFSKSQKALLKTLGEGE